MGVTNTSTVMMDQWKTVDQCQFEAVNSVLNRNLGTAEDTIGNTETNSTYQFQLDKILPRGCPVDHSSDPPLAVAYYKMVRRYALDGDISVNSVHRCNLTEIMDSHTFGVGEGALAAVISTPTGHIGPIYIGTEKQSAAICDVWTSSTNGLPVGEVSGKLLGQARVQYIKDNFLMFQL